MSKKTPKKSAKPIPDPQSSVDQKQDHNRKSSNTNQEMERMETFPKTNTFPKKWDLSGLIKK